MDWLMDPEVWPGLMTLTALEIVLGIDNLVFVAILVARVQPRYQPLARNLGLIAMGVMIVAAGPTTAFVERHPTVKMLALSFLLLIGMTLMADGVGMHVPKGYIYAAIGFSAGVELLNQLASRRQRERGGGSRGAATRRP